MLITIKTTHKPATDLGYLLHKHPDKVQSVELSVGTAHIFYPEKTEESTTICLLLDIDSIAIIRNIRSSNNEGFVLGDYVNDRPYVASSFMSVAIAKAFSSAMNGRCKEKPELVDTKLPLEVRVAVLPAPNGGEFLIRKLFEPLGYTVELTRHQLDEQFSEWGMSRYYTLVLANTITIKELLSHLYILIPVLDNDKHYFIDSFEVDKLLQKGEGWLSKHPEKEQITRRYLVNIASLSRRALERLSEGEELGQPSESRDDNSSCLQKIEPTDNSSQAEKTEQAAMQKPRVSLHDKRLQLIAEKIASLDVKTVIDLGCGEGKLLGLLLKQKQLDRLVGMDVSYSELLKAKERLHFDDLPQKQKDRISLFQGSLIYKDKRLEGFDLAAVIEVIEHLDLNRIQAFERVLFEFAKPTIVILTSPNKEYNAMFEHLAPGSLRHSDHRFEWTRAEFLAWAEATAKKYAYTAEVLPLGDEVEKLGSPSQMAIFTRKVS